MGGMGAECCFGLGTPVRTSPAMAAYDPSILSHRRGGEQPMMNAATTRVRHFMRRSRVDAANGAGRKVVLCVWCLAAHDSPRITCDEQLFVGRYCPEFDASSIPVEPAFGATRESGIASGIRLDS